MSRQTTRLRQSSRPQLQDFQYFKTKFGEKNREVKDQLRSLALLQNQFPGGSQYMEPKSLEEEQGNNNLSGRGVLLGQQKDRYGTGGGFSQQELIGRFNQLSDQILLLNDELEEIIKQIGQLSNLTSSERSVQVRLKNQLKELSAEYTQIKKLIKTQMKVWQNFGANSRSSRQNGSLSVQNRRLRSLAGESNNLDKTLSLTSQILEEGSQSASQLDKQTGRLQNAGKNVEKMQSSAIPGADRLIGLIGARQKKNQIILALVISVCLVCILSSLGVIGTLKGCVRYYYHLQQKEAESNGEQSGQQNQVDGQDSEMQQSIANSHEGEMDIVS